jgi:hypothetical protein
MPLNGKFQLEIYNNLNHFVIWFNLLNTTKGRKSLFFDFTQNRSHKNPFTLRVIILLN